MHRKVGVRSRARARFSCSVLTKGVCHLDRQGLLRFITEAKSIYRLYTEHIGIPRGQPMNHKPKQSNINKRSKNMSKQTEVLTDR